VNMNFGRHLVCLLVSFRLRIHRCEKFYREQLFLLETFRPKIHTFNNHYATKQNFLSEGVNFFHMKSWVSTNKNSYGLGLVEPIKFWPILAGQMVEFLSLTFSAYLPFPKQ